MRTCLFVAAVALCGCGLQAENAEKTAPIPVAAEQPDNPEAAAKWVEGVGGKLTRDDAAPGKPVVEVQFLPLNKKVTNDGLKELKAFKGLKSLTIYFCEQIGDDGMKHVKELTGLEQLTLGNTSVTDAGLAELKGLTKLKKLVVSGCVRMTDKSADTIKGFTDLEELSLPSTYTETGLRKLAGLKKLKSLYLGGCRELTDDVVKFIADNMPELESLELGTTDGTDITDASVPHLARLKKLTTLGIAGSKMTDGGVRTLRDKLPDCTIRRK